VRRAAPRDRLLLHAGPRGDRRSRSGRSQQLCGSMVYPRLATARGQRASSIGRGDPGPHRQGRIPTFTSTCTELLRPTGSSSFRMRGLAASSVPCLAAATSMWRTTADTRRYSTETPPLGASHRTSTTRYCPRPTPDTHDCFVCSQPPLQPTMTNRAWFRQIRSVSCFGRRRAPEARELARSLSST
jgi:hypothetical protein